MRFDHFKGRGRFDDGTNSDNSERPSQYGQPEDENRPLPFPGPQRQDPVDRPEGDEPPKVVSMDSLRRKGILRDPQKLSLFIQLCLTLLLISLLLYSLFPFFAVMDRLEIPIRRVVYIPLAIVAIVVFFGRRTLKLIRQLRERRR